MTGWERDEQTARIEHMARLMERGVRADVIASEFKATTKELDAARHKIRRRRNG